MIHPYAFWYPGIWYSSIDQSFHLFVHRFFSLMCMLPYKEGYESSGLVLRHHLLQCLCSDRKVVICWDHPHHHSANDTGFLHWWVGLSNKARTRDYIATIASISELIIYLGVASISNWQDNKSKFPKVSIDPKNKKTSYFFRGVGNQFGNNVSLWLLRIGFLDTFHCFEASGKQRYQSRFTSCTLEERE